MNELFAEIKGIKELEAAIKRNPQVVLNEARNFLMRGTAAYKSGIKNSPWRVGGSGGGSPVAAFNGGNLRDTHRTEIRALTAKIGPSAAYSGYVHEGTRKMKKRPWLDFVKTKKEKDIEKLYKDMLKNITADLAR